MPTRIEGSPSQGRVEAANSESETRYRVLDDAAGQGSCTIRVMFDAADRPTDFQFLEVNPWFEEQTGIRDAPGRWMREIAPDQEQHWFDIYGRIALTGAPIRFEAGSARLDRWWSVYACRVGDPADRTLAVLFSDITARKQAETSLRESEERYRKALQVGRIGSWEANFGTGIRSWSPEGMELFGLDLPDGRGQVGGERDEWCAALHPDERERDFPEHVYGTLARQDRLHVEYRIVRPDGCVVWLHGHAEVVERDAEGRTVRILNVAADISESRVAVRALRESEERFRSFAENSADTLWILDVGSRKLEYLSPAFETMWGESRERVLADLDRWGDLVHPDDREHAAEGMSRLLAAGSYQQEYRIVRPSDGAVRWIQDTGFAIRDEDGRVRRVGGIAQDVTERRVGEGRVRASRRRLRSLIEGIPQLVWRAVGGGERTWSSPQWTRITGLSEVESEGWGWLRALHDDDRSQAREAWLRAAEAEGGFEVEYRLRIAADGRHRWFTTRATPVRDEDGAIVEWLGTSTDIDELRSLHEHQRLLLAELQHRVRNTLAVIRSIARRTASSSETVEDYAIELDGRLNAFARVQAAVTRNPSAGIDLEYLVADELHVHMTRDGDQALVLGPPVRLQPKAAETLGLAFHELATNAVKYGALATPNGRVEVTWDRTGTDDDERLFLVWKESGVAPAALPPKRRGFGTDLLTRSLAYELKARTEHVIGPDGLRFTLELPLSPIILSARETGGLPAAAPLLPPTLANRDCRA